MKLTTAFPRLIWTLAFFVPLVAGAEIYSLPKNHRVVEDLDSHWRFIRQDVADAQKPGFDDSSWSVIDLPHTWDNRDGEDGGDNYYRGVGWYRNHFTVKKHFAKRRFFLKFDGGFSVADVWINGHFLGEHRGGFAAFVFDATPFVRVGKDNVIAVKVNNAYNPDIPPLSADFTFFGGLYRKVHLLITDPVQISPLDYGSPGVFLKTENVTSNSANLQITTLVSNSLSKAKTVMVRAVITDAATNVVTVLTNIVTIPPSSLSKVIVNTGVARPHLWNGLDDPYLYRAFVEVWKGSNVVDVVNQPLGFRWFTIDPDKGFFLNGRHYDLHGVSMHQDWLDCGWALTDAQRETNFALLKEIGATAVRLSHYQQNEQTYELADQDGIILWSEIPLINRITESPAFYENAKQQLKELIRQNYNHPAIVCWGIFNEITLLGGPSATNLVSQLAQLEAREDPTRPSTCASAAGDSHPSNWYSDIMAFNKYFGWYIGPTNGFAAWADNVHKHYPNRCIGVSEFGAGASIFQHEENLVRPKPGGPFHPEEWQNYIHEICWQQMKARPYLWCKFVWCMFDFASDGRNEGDHPGRNDKGLVTYDRKIRKDAFYFYKANWTTNPMVYITGHTFTNRQTNSITAKVYSNCDSVELFVNGISQGTRTSDNCIFTWPVELKAGENSVEAAGVKNSVEVSDSLIWIAPTNRLAHLEETKFYANSN